MYDDHTLVRWNTNQWTYAWYLHTCWITGVTCLWCTRVWRFDQDIHPCFVRSHARYLLKKLLFAVFRVAARISFMNMLLGLTVLQALIMSRFTSLRHNFIIIFLSLGAWVEGLVKLDFNYIWNIFLFLICVIFQAKFKYEIRFFFGRSVKM